eukprot:11342038-Alexandrium_andersonii.AAC.1
MGANRRLAVGVGDLLGDREGGRHRPPNPSEGALDVRHALAPLPEPGVPEVVEVRAEPGLSMLPERAPSHMLPESHGAHMGGEGAEARAEA